MMITVHMPPKGGASVDLRVAAATMTAREQKRLFKRIGQYISDEDCQRAMDDLADAILESRARAAQEILEGKWPVEKPVPMAVLQRFYDAQLPIVLSACKKPDILVQYEENKKERS